MKQTITVVGSANVDYVIHTDRMPYAGETIVGGGFAVGAGGKGLNQAVAVSKLGGKVTFFGVLGDDQNAALLQNMLADSGVGFAGVCAENAATGVAMITVAGGDNAIILDAGANALLTPTMIREHAALIQNSDYCVIQLEIPVESVEALCELAAAAQTKVVLNPAPFKALSPTVLQAVEWLIPNEHEVSALTGITVDSVESAKEAIAVLRQQGVRQAVITLGGRGCVYTDAGKIVHHPAEQAAVVDTTSAGDCFIGAFVTKLSEGALVSAAIDFATKAAAVTVSRRGAAGSIPFAWEIT